MMCSELLSPIAIKAESGDAYDAIIRLATDAQRFGLALQSLAVKVRPDGSADLHMVVEAQAPVDRDQVLRRFARHPTVSAVQAIEAESDT